MTSLPAMRWQGGGTTPLEQAFAPEARIEGRFRVERLLGQGAASRVYLAHDEHLERDVALKVLCPAAGAPALALFRRFRREGLLLARLRSPHVLTVFGLGNHAGHAYLVLEHVEGETLRSLADTAGPLPLDVTIGLLGQLATGLDAVHEAGLVHRDVKLENALVTSRYEVTLADFGLARGLDEAAEDAALRAGSPAYMAPEVLAGGSGSPASDRWALAVCGYELLTGSLPFEGDDLAGLTRAIQAAQPLAPSAHVEVSAAVDAVFAQAFSLAEDRYESGQALVDALREARKMQVRRREGPRILAVDDDPGARKLYRLIFERIFPGAEVEEAEDGLVALALAKADPPDLMVIDLEMPRLDGRGLCAALAQAPELSQTVRVVVSGALDRSTEAILSGFGVAHCLPKPLSTERLIEVSRTHLALLRRS